MGLGQLISRPLFGAIGYSPKVKPYVTYSFAAVVCGVATITIIYTRNFAGQLIAIFVLGAGIGGCLVYVPVILAYFHGKENIGLGASLIAPCHGVMALTVPTFAGWLRDRYGDYKGAFWLAVLSYFVAAAVAMSLPFVDATVKRRRKSRKGRLSKNVHDEINDRETKTKLRTMEQHR
ncbi:monocarboxylate transporter 10-like [Ptychodera flava]|uniref:monocarboxylate transporter 10-like n=1 Tax=Ptychodera flava TaxID=63121 RepID=UPI00396A7B09